MDRASGGARRPRAAPTASAGRRQVAAGRRNPGARIERRERSGFALALQRERERLYHPRVELAARAVAQLGQGRLVVEPRGIGPSAGHRIKRVAHRDDARAERDLLTGEPIWVAATVPALVRGAHQRGHRRQRRGLAENALADDRVAAHERPLVRVQRAWLGEDRVRYSRLADVVQFSPSRELVELLRRQVETAADRERELADVVEVDVQVRLALAQQLHEYVSRLMAGRAPPAALVRVNADDRQPERLGPRARP